MTSASTERQLYETLVKALPYVERVANTNPTGVVPALKKRQLEAATLANAIRKLLDEAS